MNLLGRYLEDGRVCPADPVGAVDWYRRSATGGDFRGQFSYAAVLADEGNVEEALVWLRKALAGGNLNFLRVASQTLLSAVNPHIREMAALYHQRVVQMSDERSVPGVVELV
ncbi:hypothetical protein D9M71_699420 [compost metagenome]